MPTRPWVLALTGAPGSGKSTTARELARVTGAAVLDQDAMTNPLVDIVADLIGAEDYDDVGLANLVREARYSCLVRVASDCVSAGVPVIMVAPFTAERRDADRWAAWDAEVAAAGGRAVLGWLRIDPLDLRMRLSGRAASRDAAKLADVDNYLASLDLAPPSVPHLAVEAVATPAVQANHLRAALS